MMKAVSISETSVNFYHTTRRNIPEDSHLRPCIWSDSNNEADTAVVNILRTNQDWKQTIQLPSRGSSTNSVTRPAGWTTGVRGRVLLLAIPSRPALRAQHTPTQWVPRSFPGG
jgi:hypothetical protein